MALVYVHKCPNNKLYIGVTGNKYPSRRWGKGGNGYSSQHLFWKAIEKYGWDNIEHIILIDNIPIEIANEIEEYLIEKYHTNDFRYGYNIASGGKVNHGYHLTDEHRQHLSESHKEYLRCHGHPQKGKSLSEEVKLKIREGRMGYSPSPETCNKISNALKGHSVSEATREKISKSRTGMEFTEEHKRHISESKKGKPGHESCWKGKHLPKEMREKISRSNTGKPKSEETKRKLSEAAKGKHSGKRRPMSEETKRKISEAHKNRVRLMNSMIEVEVN